MLTGCYHSYFGPGRVGISVGSPRGVRAGYRIYRTLAPTRPMLDLPYARYREIFFGEILAKLDPREQWDRVHELAAGAEPVMLCFEKPPFTATNWCHRRMVAAWFEDTLGEAVEEANGWGMAGERGEDKPPDLFDDVTPFLGKTFTWSGHQYSVIGPDPDNPGQAIVRDEIDQSEFSVSAEALQRRLR